MESGVPHVVAVPFPFTQGHISAVMNFCLKLAERGIQVTVVDIQMGEITSPVRVPESMASKRLEVSFPVRFDNMTDEMFTELFRMIYEDLQAPFEQLLSTLAPVCCIVSDSMYPWTQASANKIGISRINVWTASASAMSVDFYVPQLLESGNIPVDDSNKDKLVTCIPGLNSIEGNDVPVMYHANNIMTTTDPGYARKIARSIILKNDAWVMVNTFNELEATVLEAAKLHINKNCVALGPLISNKAGSNPNNKACLSWLKSKDATSVVYVAFGSAGVLSKSEFDDVRDGLEQYCGYPFLWVLRPKGVSPGIDIQEFQKTCAARGCLVVDWAPQVEVLAHPAVGAFVTHCGWNSVLDAVSGGVPLIGRPRAAEQNLNMRLVELLGVGARLDLTKFAATIQGVLENVQMKKKAQELKGASQRAALENATRLDTIVEDLWKMHSAY